jgi:hypothetical protein
MPCGEHWSVWVPLVGWLRDSSICFVLPTNSSLVGINLLMNSLFYSVFETPSLCNSYVFTCLYFLPHIPFLFVCFSLSYVLKSSIPNRPSYLDSDFIVLLCYTLTYHFSVIFDLTARVLRITLISRWFPLHICTYMCII